LPFHPCNRSVQPLLEGKAKKVLTTENALLHCAVNSTASQEVEFLNFHKPP